MKIEQVWQVKMDDGFTWLPETKAVNGMVFAKVEKWDRAFVRFSTGKALCLSRGQSKFANSPIVDQMVDLRQKKCDELLQEALRTEDDADDFVPDRCKRRRKRKPRVCKPVDLVLIDAVIDVLVDVGPDQWSVKMLSDGLGSHVVWFELTEANARTLRFKTMAAIAAGEYGTTYERKPA
jgi:hypothetical protein